MSYRNISSPPFCPFDCCCTFFRNPIWNDGKLFPCKRTKGWETALRIIFCLDIGHFDEDNEEGNLQWPPQRNTQISPRIKRQFIELFFHHPSCSHYHKSWLYLDNTSKHTYHNWCSDNDLTSYLSRNICVLQNYDTMNTTDVS